VVAGVAVRSRAGRRLMSRSSPRTEWERCGKPCRVLHADGHSRGGRCTAGFLTGIQSDWNDEEVALLTSAPANRLGV